MEPLCRTWFRVGLFLAPELILFLQRPRRSVERRPESAHGGALIGLRNSRKHLPGKPDHDAGFTGA
jgi:hypothetical protein